MTNPPHKTNDQTVENNHSTTQLYRPPDEHQTKRHHVRRRSYYPSTIRLVLGHLLSFLRFLLYKLFESNNLPLVLDFIYHAFLARQFTRYSNRYLQNYMPQETPQNTNWRKKLANVFSKQSNTPLPQADPPQIAVDILENLGGVQLALALLSLLALRLTDKTLSSQKVVLLVLATADGAKTWFDVKHWRSGPLSLRIFREMASGSLLVTLMNVIAYIASVRKSGALL